MCPKMLQVTPVTCNISGHLIQLIIPQTGSRPGNLLCPHYVWTLSNENSFDRLRNPSTFLKCVVFVTTSAGLPYIFRRAFHLTTGRLCFIALRCVQLFNTIERVWNGYKEVGMAYNVSDSSLRIYIQHSWRRR